MIYKDGGMKLAIFKAHHSPYGWDKRELVVSHYGVEDNEFTYDYVSDKVDEVYSTFDKDEIDELLTKVKQYKNG